MGKYNNIYIESFIKTSQQDTTQYYPPNQHILCLRIVLTAIFVSKIFLSF